MKLCAVQIFSVKGDVAKNIENHKKAILWAVDEGAQFIVFPELSITGYEPSLAEQLASNVQDSRLDELQSLCDEIKVTVCVGLPIETDHLPLIGMVVLSPQSSRQLYCKQHLHSDELPDFSEGELDLMLVREEVKIAPAICYESLLDEHAEKAFRNGATHYFASVAKPSRGVEKANIHMPQIAKRHGMTVIMANAVGPSDNFISYGGTAVWDKKGRCLAQLDHTREGLLIFDTQTNLARLIHSA